MNKIQTQKPAKAQTNAKTKVDSIEQLYKAIGITAVAAACTAKQKKNNVGAC